MAEQPDMPQAEKLQPEPKPQPEPQAYTTPKDGLLEVYSNYINMNWGIADVRIRFGQLIPISGKAETPLTPPERVIEERVAVTISWHQAKLLHGLLGDAVSRYEKTNGELMFPTLPS